MRTFHIQRHKDCSGISGTGRVAEGVLFFDGTIALRWQTKTPTLSFFNSLADLEAIHGHDGASEIVWHKSVDFADEVLSKEEAQDRTVYEDEYTCFPV